MIEKRLGPLTYSEHLALEDWQNEHSHSVNQANDYFEGLNGGMTTNGSSEVGPLAYSVIPRTLSDKLTTRAAGYPSKPA